MTLAFILIGQPGKGEKGEDMQGSATGRNLTWAAAEDRASVHVARRTAIFKCNLNSLTVNVEYI